MLEICFSNSLKGSLMCAKEKRGGRVIVASVFGWDENGRQPTDEEIEAHKRRIQEEHEKAQAEMIPLGGRSWQVLAFPFGLSQGNISVVDAEGQWQEFHRLLETDAEVRIWYDPNNPDDICGLYWFLWMLKEKELSLRLALMPLPDYFQKDDGSIHVCRGWGEIPPEELGHYLYLQREMSVGFRTMACTLWEKLRKENAPLRVLINGKITSVEEDFYDSFIRSELGKQPEIFKEPQFIGKVLCESCLYAVGDEFVHRRLTEMVKQGELQIITPGEDGGYWGQILKKIR